jgi:DNA topoisomerase-1
MFTETGGIAQAAAADDARAAGLIYVNDADPGIRRVKRGAVFGYVDAAGKTIRDRDVLKRIRAIAIPPAWTEVWIAPSPRGHIQATGRDARGRKQYRYHGGFRASREETKYQHIFAFAGALRKLRLRVKRDMARRGLPREKVIATVVHLLDTTLIRVGNASYARENRSYGLTTLRDKHVAVNGAELRFAFMGKSGKTWQLRVRDRRVARIVKSCQELPGQHLFQYLDETGMRQSVGSSDVNAYLREATGMDVTAKDFRTFAGTVLAAAALSAYQPFDTAALAKANLREAIEQVADRLGNTPTICRKCYIHPAIAEAYLEGSLTLQLTAASANGTSAALRPDEKAVLAFLKQRLKSAKGDARSSGGRAT